MRKTKKRFNNKINVRTKGKFLLDFLFDISRFPSIFHVQMGCYNNINESKSAPTFPRIHWMFILADKLFLLKYRRGRLPKGPTLFFRRHTCFKRISTFVYPGTFEFSQSSWINKWKRVLRKNQTEIWSCHENQPFSQPCTAWKVSLNLNVNFPLKTVSENMLRSSFAC